MLKPRHARPRLVPDRKASAGAARLQTLVRCAFHTSLNLVRFCLLANAARFTHTSPGPPMRANLEQAGTSFWGIHVRHCRQFCAGPVQSADSDCDLGLPLRGGKPGLHDGAAERLHGRRVPALQFRDPGYRTRQGLHGQAAIPAQSALPGIFQARTAGPDCRRSIGRFQADARAQATQAPEASSARRHLKRPPALFPYRPDSVCSRVFSTSLSERFAGAIRIHHARSDA
jgi:hypothetical protein